MVRRCSRCQNPYHTDDPNQYHCEPCLKHYMPHKAKDVNPMEIHPAGQTMDLRSGTKPKGKTISEILKGG